MKKSELICAVAASAEVSKAEATRVIEALQAEITAAISKGEEVTLPGFGKFVPSERKARTGRNPATGETIEIAASKGVSFKAQKALKDALNA